MSQATTTLVCPRCNSPSAELMNIEAGMRLALQAGGEGQIPDRTCPVCYNELTGKVSKGVKLRLEKQAQAKNKALMWKSRVNLVRHARALMAQKAFSEAAVSYEKYIRVLEMAHELKKGELTPEIFSKSTRSKEMTVVATAYWDLIRIYDTSGAYRDRMAAAARKLAEFAPYSPIFPDIIRKAEQFVKTAKNPDIVRGFLRLSRRNRPRCFIATEVYSYPKHPSIETLREFRDSVLKSSPWGRKLVCFYYRHSRTWARQIAQHRSAKAALRGLFTAIAWVLKKLP